MTETFCTHCGGLHEPGGKPCREPPLVGRILPDGLRVIRAVRRINAGVVCRAQYPGSDDEVEVLFLLPERGAELRDKSLRGAGMKHPNVATVRAVGETEQGVRYVAFEIFEGELLSEVLAARHVFPLPGSLDLVLQAAAGLQAAHEAGLLHGNLSPDAILITRTLDGRRLVKLIRFGMMQLSADPSEGGDVSGGYAAPERLAGHPPDERSDVYSLGAVLHHLLYGGPPGGRDLEESVPDGVRAVISKALERLPERRFPTAAAFAQALAGASQKLQALAGASQKPEPWRRGVALGARVAAAAAALLIVVSAGLWLRRTTERSKSDTAPVEAAVRPDTGAGLEVRESVATPSGLADTAPGPLPLERRHRHSAASASRPADSAASDTLLVDLRSVDSTIQVDLRYATANNFMGAPLPGYQAQRALLRQKAAAALGRVQARLRSKGLGLRVFDAYRPVRATRAMVHWAESTGRQELLESGYIAERSRHNLGVAVDLTLVDLVTGTDIPMGTTFDSFATSAQMANADGEALRNRQILAQAMASEGFSPYGQAWWHFNYPLEGAVPLDRVIR